MEAEDSPVRQSHLMSEFQTSRLTDGMKTDANCHLTLHNLCRKSPLMISKVKNQTSVANLLKYLCLKFPLMILLEVLLCTPEVRVRLRKA